MAYSIIEIHDDSPFINKVIELGDKNCETLGFMPHNAFIEAAKKGFIYGAIEDDDLVGYLLFRIVKTKDKAAITHLCVDERYREQGFGRALVDHLKNKTRNLHGISLYCRRDYKANDFWPRMGFQYISEKPGRGKDQMPLTCFWFDHDHPSLDKLAGELSIQSKPFKATIDTNIFIALFENPKHILLADWLLDDLLLCVTPELNNEINRDNDNQRRREMLNYASTFTAISTNQPKYDQIEKLLRQYFPLSMTVQDESDLKQLGYAIAANMDFFVTDDRRLIDQVKDYVLKTFGLSIVAEDDLIIYFDELINKAVYQTNRLAGSLILISRVQSGQSDNLADIFHRSCNEKKSYFRNRLSHFLTHPKNFESFLISTRDTGPIAIIVHSFKENQTLEIPFIRIIPGSYLPALESQLIFWSVSEGVKRGDFIVKVTDDNLSHGILTALKENSFNINQNYWEKYNVIGIYTCSDLDLMLCDLQAKLKTNNLTIDNISALLRDASISQDTQKMLQVEKLLWPVKISHPYISIYVVPIQPHWAMDLFDSELGTQTLFGSDPSRVLMMENVILLFRFLNSRSCQVVKLHQLLQEEFITSYLPNYTNWVIYRKGKTMPSKAILLSIRPKYAEKVFDGTKRVELRRVRPNLSIGDLVVVYVSSPVKQIWGSFEVEQIVEKPLDELWNLVQNDAGVSRIEFDNYYNGLECGFGIYIKNFVSETTPISLNEL
ncbi:MAG: GNAT family N-acetyltransferase, partial [Candidatus Omnitrophica bacterium]|nr:GNAT family N-acetyltransferase [Candidatus Omnitrophota bacterium]